MKQRKWTKEFIVDRLRTWRAEGVPVNSLWRKDPAMTAAEEKELLNAASGWRCKR